MLITDPAAEVQPLLGDSCEVCGDPRYWKQPYCRSHYRRWKRHGDPLAGQTRTKDVTSEVAPLTVFSALTVMSRSFFDPSDGKRKVFVRCYCKKVVLARTDGLRHGFNKSCGCKPFASRRYVNKSGYIDLWEPDHPNATKQGKVLEHVKVMSGIIGRPLLPGENVHHKNGVRDDNRPENLELWSTSQPKGQRVEDKVAWAKELLSLYEPEALR